MRQVYLIGIGMGNPDLLTVRARKIIERSDCLIGAKRMLEAVQGICRPEAERLLRPYGYTATDEESALQRLRERLSAGGDFPHEIGAFLGYPLEDVAGYIHNRGQNCRCMGCWKVYCNECEARRTFAKLKKCSEVYGRLWRQGRTVPELSVAA